MLTRRLRLRGWGEGLRNEHPYWEPAPRFGQVSTGEVHPSPHYVGYIVEISNLWNSRVATT